MTYRVAINDVTYEVQGDVELVHDPATGLVRFKHSVPAPPSVAASSRSASLRSAPPQRPAPVLEHEEAPDRVARRLERSHKERRLETEILRVLEERGPTATRGMTWAILGRASPAASRADLHRTLEFMAQRGLIYSDRRTKTAQAVYSLAPITGS
jgi:hypothetical protein